MLSVMYCPLLAVECRDLKTWWRVEKEGRSPGNAEQHLSIMPYLYSGEVKEGEGGGGEKGEIERGGKQGGREGRREKGGQGGREGGGEKIG